MAIGPDFEWDQAKDRINRTKHGVGFVDAQGAFQDPRRVIAEDLEHSEGEKRYFCFGVVGGGVMTVRSHGGTAAFASSEPAIGEKDERSMSNRTVRYTEGEIGKVRVVKDFLPSADELVPATDNVKVTLTLTRRSLAFFKSEAKRRRVPYQRMIRALVDQYAEKQARGGK
jgi:hypothetical protein